MLLNTATQDGKRVRIGFGKDPGQAGKSQALHLVRALSGFTVTPASESGDKLTRFGPFSSQCRAGNVKIRRGSWNEELFRVLEGFPDLAHDDEVDACSGALEMLNPQMKSWGIFELMRQQAQGLKEQRQPPPSKTCWPRLGRVAGRARGRRQAVARCRALAPDVGDKLAIPHAEHREGPCEDPSDGASVAISLPRTNRKSVICRSA